MNSPQTWYITQQEDQTCTVIAMTNKLPETKYSYWGPFNSQEEAIAKRVGLIRAGKCKPH